MTELPLPRLTATGPPRPKKKVNEELVKVSGGGREGAAPRTSKRKKIHQKKKKRPKVASASAAPAVGVAVGGGRGSGGGGGGGRCCEDFNTGTHTAKRASARARKSGFGGGLMADVMMYLCDTERQRPSS